MEPPGRSNWQPVGIRYAQFWACVLGTRTSCDELAQNVDGGTAFSHSGGGPGEEGQPVRTSF